MLQAVSTKTDTRCLRGIRRDTKPNERQMSLPAEKWAAW